MTAEAMIALAFMQCIASSVAFGYSLASKDPRTILLPTFTLSVGVAELMILLKPIILP